LLICVNYAVHPIAGETCEFAAPQAATDQQAERDAIAPGYLSAVQTLLTSQRSSLH